MEQARKRIMRCTHPTPCEICLTDCKRAETTAKEDRIRADLLAVCVRAKRYLGDSTVLAALSAHTVSRTSVAKQLEAAIAKAKP